MPFRWKVERESIIDGDFIDENGVRTKADDSIHMEYVRGIPPDFDKVIKKLRLPEGLCK